MRKLASWCFRHRWSTVHRLDRRAGRAESRSTPRRAAPTPTTSSCPTPAASTRSGCCSAPRRRPSGETDQLVIAVKHGKVTDPAVGARAEPLFAKVAPAARRRPRGLARTRRRPAARSPPTGRSRSPTSPSPTPPTSNKITAAQARALRPDDHVGLGRRRPVPGRGQHRRGRQHAQPGQRPAVRLHRRGDRPVPRVRLVDGDGRCR